jgi:hypothetical protein
MPDLEAYDLVAYDVETGEEVFNWPNLVNTRRFDTPDVIEVGDAKWVVVGVRNISTKQLRLIDVKRLP